MVFRQRRAKTPLSEFVESLWFYDQRDVGHRLEKLLPNGTVELLIDLSPGPKRLYDRNDLTVFRECRKAWVSGIQREYIVFGAESGASMMGVHFRVGGAAPFFGFPVSELTDAVVELDLIWKREISVLRERLLAEAAIDGKFDLVEEFLFKKAQRQLQPDATMRAALQRMRRSPAVSPRDLASTLGLTQKALIARFNGRVGCTPKTTARIMRFQHSLKELHAPAPADVADLALRLGYYDQAHMIHDFRQFAGMTPGDYLRERTPYQDYVFID